MVKIMLGFGAARVVVNVSELPRDGDILDVPNTVEWAQCGGQLHIAGKRVIVKGMPQWVVIDFQRMPWFDIVV